ncbi:LuxR family transcriptional regulator [Erwinia sp. HDF1-3R]|uniref:LuxR family transcriptional regulator n=1 Tax=Erwinia sp. HDF1-3R TaxID=3141543 RepID=UPI0031F4E256
MIQPLFNKEAINTVIQDYLEVELKTLKNINYAYAIRNKNNPADFSIISNRREWFEVYIDNSFHHIDPVLSRAQQRLTPFFWDEKSLMQRGVQIPRLFDMACHHNITSGCTFVVHDQHNNLVVLSLFLNPYSDSQLKNALHCNKDRVQMLLVTAHEQLITLYQEQSKAPAKKMTTGQLLSRRENEIFYWASVGKSYQEIALILGIKVTTVKFHIGNVVRKLGVSNAKHAIRLGVELDIIRPHYAI